MLYPHIDIEEITNLGERMVAEALLAHCPEEWMIIYSKSWLWRDMRYNCDRFKEGEIDFVIIVPGKGMVLLEVKSAKRYRLTGDGKWQRYDEAASRWVTYSKSPWEQVTANKHALVNILLKRCSFNRLPCGYAAAVIFPRGVMDGQLPAGEDDPAMIVQATDMPNIVHIIKDILDGWWRGEGKTDDIKRLLCPSGAKFCSSLSLDIQYQNRKLVRLTDHQFRILQGLKYHNMIQVLGGAGTGKTLLGLELAKEAVQAGQRVLFLCFSRKLASWLSANVEHESLVITNFHRLARKYTIEASLVWPDEPSGSFWREGVNELFLEAIYSLGDSALFDTVIVDEAQDFVGEWLILVRELWNESGKIVFFADENQTIFGGQIFDHKQVVKFVLQDNCRNVKPIAILCNNILRDSGVSVDPGIARLLPAGRSPNVTKWGLPENRRAEVVNQIKKWRNDGLSPAQIAVLSPWLENNSMGIVHDDSVVEGVEFTRNLDIWHEGKACLFDTIKGFKGLEADAVVLVDATDINAGFTLQDAYVACSRAKHELLIVPVNIEASNLFTNWLSA